MNWYEATTWADGLSYYDSVRGVTYADWRLPTTTQPDASCEHPTDPGGGFPLQGVGAGCTGSEIGHLFNVDGISISSSDVFANVQSIDYWSDTEYAPSTDNAWGFRFDDGGQNHNPKLHNHYARAVRPGDVVPIPAAIWLFGSALGLIGWMRHKSA